MTQTINSVSQRRQWVANKNVSISNCYELGREIQITILDYELSTFKGGHVSYTGIDRFGRHDEVLKDEIPDYVKYPVSCRNLHHKLSNKGVYVDFYKEKRTWCCCISDKYFEAVGKNTNIVIAFLTAVFQTKGIILDVKIPKKELNVWYKSLSDDYQVHLITDNLSVEIKKIKDLKIPKEFE